MGVNGGTERASSLGVDRGRGRGRGLNTALANKVVGVQTRTEGILVSDSEVKEGGIINIKPKIKIKRVATSINQEAVQKCTSGNQGVVASDLVQSEVMVEPPLGKDADVGRSEQQQVENGVMMRELGPAVGNASLAKLESRISTLELEVLNI